MKNRNDTNFSNDISSLLSDNEIEKLCSQDILIIENFDRNQLDGCCYEFRVGHISYSYDYEKKITKQNEQKEHIIHPFETLTIITLEKVNITDQYFLFIFSKGSLFSLGLTPVSTGADPGFKGHLGITMTNLSMRPIRFKTGQSLVKGIFFKLNTKVQRLYTGQHGDATMSWPYPSQFHVDQPDFNIIDAKYWNFLPPPIKKIFNKVKIIERQINKILWLFVVLFILNILPIPIKNYWPNWWTSDLERLLNLVGSFASILGLALSLGFFSKNGDDNE